MANHTSNRLDPRSGIVKTSPKYITVDLKDLKPYKNNNGHVPHVGTMYPM